MLEGGKPPPLLLSPSHHAPSPPLSPSRPPFLYPTPPLSNISRSEKETHQSLARTILRRLKESSMAVFNLFPRHKHTKLCA